MNVLKRFFLLLLIAKSAGAQMSVTVNTVATQLAQVIAGYGVTVSNAQINCGSSGAGTFTYTGTHLGLTGGVLLTTGDATTAAGPQSNFSSTSTSNNISDPQLISIDPDATNDLCELEFDFVPICPSLSIKYVFGSEEYPTFVGSVNDGFGIFLTGPNPSGPAYSNTNIALLPNGQVVSINDVNASSNSPSFVANYNLGYNDIVYDGFTVPITSTATITPCQSYHIKFAIADALDEAYDSGVFLQYDGLSCSNSPTITPSSTASSCTGSTGTASVAIVGATPTGYSWQPGGQTTAGITNQPPGTYTCVMSFSSACSTYTQAQTVVIGSSAISPTVAVSSNTPCAGSTLSFTSTSNGVSYAWSGPNSFSSTSQNPSISPANASNSGVYTLTVTNSTGCTTVTTISAGIAPDPTVTVNSPSVCGGNSATLTATGANTYSWSPSTGLSSATGSVVTASPPTTTVYSVTGISTAGCVGGNTATVTITNNPSVTVTSATVCSGSSATLTASGASTYTWSPATGLSTTSGSVVTANPSSPTTYTVAGSVGTCSASPGTGSVAFNPLPTVTIGSNSPVCATSTLSFTAGGGVTYAWVGPNGFSSPQQNPTVASVSTLDAGVYTVTATDNLGCSASNTVNVVVLTSVTLTFSPIVACLNSTVSVSAPAGGSSYAWSGPNGFSSTLQNISVNGVSAADNGVYSVTVTSSSGCVNTGSVNLSTTSAVSFSVSPSSTSMCAGNTVTLTGLGQGGTGTYLYNWAPATGLSSTTATMVSASPAATQDYTLTLSDAGCPTAPTATVAITVTVNPLPVITFSATSLSGCEPFCTGLASQSTPTAVNTLWAFSNGQSISGAVLDTFCLAGHGVYDVKVTVFDINGCIDSLTKPAYITVYPKPIADFSWNPLTPTVINNQVQFTDQSSLGAPMIDWQWSFGDFYVPLSQDTSGLQNPSHTYENIGNYNVQLIVENQFGCRDTVTRMLIVEDEFMLYIPNAFTPSVADEVNDVFNVKGTGFMPETFDMRIFDRWGEMIYHTTDLYKGWDGSVKGGPRAKQDVYVYKITVKDFKGKKREFVGHVTLL